MAEIAGKCREHYKPPERKPDNRKPAKYRCWYWSEQWDAIRRAQLNRQPLCEECLRRGEITPAKVVDHITPHRGSWELFVDPDNLQSLCKSCHDRKTAKEDGAFGNKRKGE
jgi:5-methylcytosine-specific restriction protein A